MNKIILLICVFIAPFVCTAQNTLAVKSEREALFNLGQELIFLEKYEAALQIFSDYISKYPNELKSIDAYYYIAYCELAANNLKGETDINNFVLKYPNHPKSVYANYDVGSYYFNTKNYEKAIEHLSKVNLTMLDESDKLESNFKLGYAYMNVKNFDKAGTVFQRIKSTKNKYTYAANYYLGYVNFKNELYDISEQNLKKASENASYKSLVPQILVNVYSKQKRYDTLISYGKRVLENDENVKNKEEINLFIGEAYYQKKEYPSALEYFNTYNELGGKLTGSALYRYAFLLYKTGNYPSAIENFKKVAEQNDSLGQSASYYLALSLLKIDNKAFAFNALNQARKMQFVKEISTQAAIEYGKLGIELEKYSDVIEAMKDFLKHFPNSPDVNTVNGLLSEAYLNTKDYTSAIKQLESIKGNKTTVLSRAYQKVTYYRGTELYNEEKYDEAIDLFERSLQNDAEKDITYLCHYWLAESYSAIGKYEEAIINYQQVLKNSHRVSREIATRNFYGLGFAFYNAKEYSKALTNFKDFLDESRYINSKSMNCNATIRLADCFFAAKKYTESITYYEKGAEGNCEEADYSLLQKGIALATNNKDEEGKSALRRMIEKYPHSSYYYDAYYNVGLIDFENTRYEPSINNFSTIINDKKSASFIPLALQKRAIAYYNLKKYEKAVEDYKTILSDYKQSPIASTAVLGLQEALSRLDKSEELDKVIEDYKAANPNDLALEKVEYEKAKELYFNQKYGMSILKFKKYIAEYPNSLNVPDAKFFLADSYLKSGNNAEAKPILQEITDQSSGSFYTKALQRMAEILHEEKELDKSNHYYKKVIEAASNKKEIAQAWNGLMINYFEGKDFDSSAIYATFMIQHGAPSVTYYNRALLYLAKDALAEEKDVSTDYLIKCINSASDVSGAEALYLFAEKLYEEKQYKNSLEMLFELNTRFSEYTNYVGRGFLLIADNYVALNEMYQAKATLISIIEKASEKDLVEKAKEKLSILENQ